MAIAMDSIILFNLVVLVALVVALRRWNTKHGRLADGRFAAILTAYFSLSFVATLVPLLQSYPVETLVVDLVFVILCWAIGYPWIRWLYRQFNARK
jgi:hypothetical protein